MKILLIDDIKENLDQYENVIQDLIEDTEIIKCLHSMDAEKIAERELPDVIITDVLMPELDGIEVCKKIRANNITKDIPIIILSGSKVDAKCRINCLNAGADVFLSKPIDAAELVAQIKSMFRIIRAEEKIRLQKKEIEKLLEKTKNSLRISESNIDLILNSLPASIALIDESGKILHVNNSWKEFARNNSSENQLIPFYDFNYFEVCEKDKTDANAQIALKGLKEVLNGEIKQFDHIYPCNSPDKERWFLMRAVKLRSKEKQIIVSHLDITEQKIVEKELKAGEEKFRSLFEQHSLGIYVHDLNGKIINANPVACQQLGYSKKEILKLSVFDFHPKETNLNLSRKEILRHWSQWPPGERHLIQAEHQRKDRTIIPVEISTGSLKYGAQHHILSIVKDISEQKKVEVELKASEEKFRLIADNSPNMIFINIKGKIVYANSICEKLIGYKANELYDESFDMMNLIHSDYYQKVKENLGKHLRGQEISNYEITILSKNKAEIPVIVTTKLITYEGKQAILGIVTDITEQKELQKALAKDEERLRTILEAATEGVLAADLKTRNFVYANPEICKMFGYTNEEILSKNVRDLHPEESLDEVIEAFEAQAKGEIKLAPRLPCIRKDGSKFYANISTAHAELDDIECNIAFFSDVTELKEAHDKINDLLKEKDLILREVHHRIKNNMAAIESLFRIQSRNTNDEKLKSALLDAISRMRGMRVLYDKLYRTDKFRETSIKGYLPGLIDEIVGLFPNAGTVKIKKEISDFMITANFNFPLCIMINELLSDIMKYAFTNEIEDPEIYVSARKIGNKAEIIIKDNGIGLPKDFDINTVNGFGLKLVDMLCQQINAELDYENDNGTKWTIIIPL